MIPSFFIGVSFPIAATILFTLSGASTIGLFLGGSLVKNIIIGFVALACLALCLPSPTTAKDLKGWGVVLIHGKKGNPASLASVASALTAAGAVVATPTMPWPDGYRPYDQILGEVDRQVASLRSKGATRIALVGHSIGANIALSYAAQHGDIAAVAAIAPGHRPDRFLKHTGDSLARAKQAVAAGQGSATASFTDVNQGRTYPVRTTAAAYVSFFDPAGPAGAMARNAGRVSGGKLLWIVGTGDDGARSLAQGGKIITVKAGHKDTPQAGRADLVAWLQSL
jgi:pimeloyl-ACP methyl ester carboxylesterase